MSRTACTIDVAHKELLALLDRYPQIDRTLLEELAADWLLDAQVDIDFEDIRVILDKPGRLVCALEEIDRIDEVLDSLERLVIVMLPDDCSESSPLGALLVVRSSTWIDLSKITEMMKKFRSCLRNLTDSAFAFYIDPKVQSITLRVVLSGVVQINRDSME